MGTVNDLVTCLRNAKRAGHRSCRVSNNSLNTAVLRVLETEGFISSNQVKDSRIEVAFKVDVAGRFAIDGIEACNHPGRRKYVGSRTIPTVRGGCGVVIVSTQLGVMSGREARNKNVGGEILAQVW